MPHGAGGHDVEHRQPVQPAGMIEADAIPHAGTTIMPSNGEMACPRCSIIRTMASPMARLE